MPSNNLENKTFYRFVKVLYFFSVILLSIIFIFVGWYYRPTSYVDYSESYILCKGGQKISFANANISSVGVDSATFGAYNDENAKGACLPYEKRLLRDRITGEEKIVLVSEFENYGLEMPSTADVTYKFKAVQSLRGSYVEVVSWWGLGIGGTIILLTIVRGTLNYIAFGKFR